jgi:hypothetical protein
MEVILCIGGLVLLVWSVVEFADRLGLKFVMEMPPSRYLLYAWGAWLLLLAVTVCR